MQGCGDNTLMVSSMQSQFVAAPSLVLAGNYSADQLYSSLDAFLESPMWGERETSENKVISNHTDIQRALEPTSFADNADPLDVRLHLDLRRCTREHRLGDAVALVHYLSGRVGRLDITVASESQAGFGEVVTVIGKSHGLAVSVQ